MIKIDFTRMNFTRMNLDTIIGLEMIQLMIFVGVINHIITNIIQEHLEKLKEIRDDIIQFVNEPDCNIRLHEYLKTF